MYFDFIDAIVTWQDEILRAIVQGEAPSPEYQDRWWENLPLDPIPIFTFALNGKAPLLDNYFTGTSTSLYSTRLIDCLRKAGVRFESFPATVLDRTTNQLLPVQYEVFHLLEIHPGLDRERSDYDDMEIRKLALTEECIQAGHALFRLDELRDIVLIREDVKAALDEAGITGCQYAPLDHFRAGVPIAARRFF
jgi:hypothetical protein